MEPTALGPRRINHTPQCLTKRSDYVNDCSTICLSYRGEYESAGVTRGTALVRRRCLPEGITDCAHEPLQRPATTAMGPERALRSPPHLRHV